MTGIIVLIRCTRCAEEPRLAEDVLLVAVLLQRAEGLMIFLYA